MTGDASAKMPSPHPPQRRERAPGSEGPPLAGYFVLDLAATPAGAFGARCLADYGADVLKIEPPAGDALRNEGPFAGGAPHPERSVPFLALNTGKRSAVLDLKTAAGRGRL